MTHTTGAEEGFFAVDGAVDELVENDEIARCHMFAERAAGGDGDDVGDA